MLSSSSFSFFCAIVFFLGHFFLLPSVFGADTPSEKQSGAQETEVEEVLEGFDEDQPGLPELSGEDFGTKIEENRVTVPEDKKLSVKGHIELGSSYNFSHRPPRAGETDWRGLSSLYVETAGEVAFAFSRDWKAKVSGRGLFDAVYSLQGRHHYTAQVLDSQEKEIELMEAFVQGRLSNHLDIKLGRQIVVWGSSDNIRVIDVLNPLDLRQPGLVDMEDLRLPVTMTRMDYYWDQFNVSGILVHEARFNKEPAFGSDFYPYAVPLPNDQEPDTFLEHPEWALALNGGFHKWDFSLNLARIFDDQPHVEIYPGTGPFLGHARLTMAGASGSVTLGNWMIKAEAAYFDGIRFYNLFGEDFQRIDVMAGLEFTGFKETFISLETVARHHTHWDQVLELPPDYAMETDFQTALRISRTLLHERLTLTYLGMLWGKQLENGGFHRFESAYEISDTLSLTGGLILYQSGDKKIETQNIGDNDRVFVRFRYHF